MGNEGNFTLRYFFEFIVYCEGILMILRHYYCILLMTQLVRKIGIAKNNALFGVKLVSLKFGWCKENYILQVCKRPKS